MHNLTFQQILETRDEFGRLLGGQFHDGALLGLSVDPPGRRAALVFADLTGMILELDLSGVIMLNATNFCQGNIVGDIWSWPLCKMPDEYWELLFRDRVPASQISKTKQCLELAHPSALALAVSASYGCQAVALCEEVVGRSRSANVKTDTDIPSRGR